MQRVAVLNSGGRDRLQPFPDFAGDPVAPGHPPVNYHAFAACTGGTFHGAVKTIGREERVVLLLVKRDLKACLRALETLRAQGKTVLIAIKEAGMLQLAPLLAAPTAFKLLERLCHRAHGCIATTQPLHQLLRAISDGPVEFIPTPYPVEDPRWNFARPAAERRGIFIGTREFDVPSRNHLAALLTARMLPEALGERVTVINTNGRGGRQMLDALYFKKERLRVVEGRLPYREYLQLMAEHKVVFQLDRSLVPGQVAGDALLCRVPCIGGNGALDQILWPQLCGHGREIDQLLEVMKYLLSDPERREHFVEQAQSNAFDHATFQAVAQKLNAFVKTL